MGIQFSMVTHWKTVSIASPMLSKEVSPSLGPAHFSRHTEVLVSHMFAPHGASDGFPIKHGLSFNPSFTTSSKNRLSIESLIKQSLKFMNESGS